MRENLDQNVGAIGCDREMRILLIKKNIDVEPNHHN